MSFQDQIAHMGTPMTAKARAHIFRQGEPDAHVYIVREGLLKAYYLSDDGRENIKSFLVAGDVIGSLAAVRGQGTCSFSLVCLEPATLIKVPFKGIFEAAQGNNTLSAQVNEFLIAFAMKKEQREYELLCLSAEQRYRRLAETQPELLDRVSQGDIALYLGVTPVGLSRIKKRVEANG